MAGLKGPAINIAVKFGAKLKRLIAEGGRSRARVARDAGVKPSLLNNYLNRGSEPIAKTALALAVQLGVSVDWLIDDSREWPPATPGCAGLGTEQIAVELGKRMLGLGVAMLSKIHEGERTDWLNIASELVKAETGKRLPKRLREVVELPVRVQSLAAELWAFDPHAPVGDPVPDGLKGDEISTSELSLLALWIRYMNLERMVGFSEVASLAIIWTTPDEFKSPLFDRIIIDTRADVAAKVKALQSLRSRQPVPMKGRYR